MYFHIALSFLNFLAEWAWKHDCLYCVSQWWTEKSSIFPMREIHFSDHERTNFSAEFTSRRQGVSKFVSKFFKSVHNGGNDRFCARLKVPPFSQKYEWQFWSKFYHLQIFFSSVAISLKKIWVPPWVIVNIFYNWCTKKNQNDLWLLLTAAKKPLIFPIKVNSGKKCCYIWHLDSWDILSQLEVGFITVFHSWRNCELQMFCGFFVSCFYSYEKWAGKFKATLTLDPPPMSHDDGWKEIHFWGPILS
jgi:hypothetical protein